MTPGVRSSGSSGPGAERRRAGARRAPPARSRRPPARPARAARPRPAAGVSAEPSRASRSRTAVDDARCRVAPGRRRAPRRPSRSCDQRHRRAHLGDHGVRRPGQRRRAASAAGRPPGRSPRRGRAGRSSPRRAAPGAPGRPRRERPRPGRAAPGGAGGEPVEPGDHPRRGGDRGHGRPGDQHDVLALRQHLVGAPGRGGAAGRPPRRRGRAGRQRAPRGPRTPCSAAAPVAGPGQHPDARRGGAPSRAASGR